jgi:hypothetical protein
MRKTSESDRSGTDVMIFLNISAKNLAENCRFCSRYYIYIILLISGVNVPNNNNYFCSKELRLPLKRIIISRFNSQN